MPSNEFVKTLKYKFFIKRNDTLPSLDITLTDRACLGNKIPYSLTAVTACTFTMINSSGDIKIMAKPAQILSYTGGTISYAWEPEDTDETGIFNGEFQLLFSGGSGNKLSIPQIGSISIEIGKDVNPF